MKKRILSILLTLCMVLSIAPAAVFAEGSTAPADITGAGTAENPYEIHTAEHLKQFRDKVNGGETDAFAKLMNDIDLGNEPWTPIGWYTTQLDYQYIGTFDGQGYTVKGLYVKDLQYAGLFGAVKDATVKNVTVTGYVAASETGTNAYAGAIAAYATGSTAITDCKSYATVTTTTAAGKDVSVTYAAHAGGMVGYATGSVALTDCVNNGTVQSTIRNNDDFSVKAYIGGIAGTADGNIRFESCVNNGALSTDCKSAESNIGGIVGCATGGAVIADCQNNGAVTGAVDHSEDPDIYYMFYTTGSNAGGIVGFGVAIRITGCHNAGAIRSDSTGNYVGSIHIGGIAGYIKSGVEEAVITDCGNVATVTGTNSSMRVLAGGIVGFVNTDGTDVSFTNCYSTGAVSAASPTSKIYIGGIAGEILPSGNGGDIVIDNCCWLTDTVESAVGFNHEGLPVNASSKSAAEFADGTVLELLKNNRTDSPWAKTGYLAAAGMTLPLLDWQTADDHNHNFEWKYTDTEHWKECDCGACSDEAAHNYVWTNENGQYWQKCSECGKETEKNPLPVITITGPDRVCKTQDYRFTFTLPEGAVDPTFGYEFKLKGDGPLFPTYENGVWTGVLPSNLYATEDSNFKITVSAQTQDGYTFSASITVTLLADHTGGDANCCEKAVCEVCGSEYGDTNPENHSDLKHFDAVEPTKETEGNIEYWFCSGCGKYYRDAEAKQEITEAEIVREKLPEDPEPPQTGDSQMFLCVTLLVISGGTMVFAAAKGRKRKQSV